MQHSLEEQIVLSRRTKNRDFLKGQNYPLQTYAWTGMQWAASQEEVNGKLPTNGPPINVTCQPPGIFANDDDIWPFIFGASQDAILCPFNGSFFAQDLIASEGFFAPGTVYRNAIGTADQNIYEKAGEIQQVQYIVSGQTTSDAKEKAKGTSYGSVVNEARGISLRAPLMLAGWGRTIGMRPTDPSTSDPNGRLNDDEHKLARETWKHGPIDVRWDERRGVWAAWNDLIADHESKNLGTPVFSTNPDESCGFPFLKGQLQDVWWVRKTVDDGGDGRSDDITKSASICTRLEHKWFNEAVASRAVAKLNSTFIICQDAGASATCGTETTFEAANGIEILTTTYFHANETAHGPLCFTLAAPPDDSFIGQLHFDGESEQWCVFTDVPRWCDREKAAATIIFNNDKFIADGIRVVADAVCNWANEVRVDVNDNFDKVKDNDAVLLNCIVNDLPVAIKICKQKAFDAFGEIVTEAFTEYSEQVKLALESTAAQIIQCIDPEKQCALEIPTPTAPALGTITIPQVALAKAINQTFEKLDELIYNHTIKVTDPCPPNSVDTTNVICDSHGPSVAP